MQLVYFLILPSALLSNNLLPFVADGGSSSLYETGAIDWNAWINMWLVVGCFALAARWLERAQRQWFDGCRVSNERGGWMQAVWMPGNPTCLLLWLWCLLQPILLVASGWTQWTCRMAGVPGSQAMSIALSLLPSIVFLMLVELIHVSRMHRIQDPSASWISKLAFGRVAMTRAILATWFIPLALPIAIATIVDVAAKLHLAGPNQGLFGTIAITLLTSVLVTLVMPHVFVKLIGAGPVDETVLSQVESTWRLGSPNVPRTLLWPTGCRMANAAVIGLFGIGRKLLLTDALIQKLNDRELAMVVLHEMSHCIRMHAWIRMIPTGIIVVLLLGALTQWTGIWLSAFCVLLFIAFIASLIAVCWWTEFDADRVAIQTILRHTEGADRDCVFRTHAMALCEALRKIYGEKNMGRRSWMHPSCNQRIKAIQAFVVHSASGPS